MTKKGLLIAGVRLFAIFLAVIALRQIGGVVAFFATDMFAVGYLALALFFVVLPFLLAVVLWFFAEQVSQRICPELIGEPDETPLDERSWFSIGSVLLGLYLVATAGSGVLYWVISYYRHQQFADGMYRAPADLWASLSSEIFLLVLGLVLILGVSGLTRLYWALRMYGLRNE